MNQHITPSQRSFMDAHKARQARFFPRPKPDPLPMPAPQVEVAKPTAFDLARPLTDPCWIAIDGNMPIPEPQERPIKISEIKRSVARYFGVSVLDMESARRTSSVVVPRQIAMYLARHLTTASFPEIGRRFGNRDHTTAIHAWQKISKRVETDPALRTSIQSIHPART